MHKIFFTFDWDVTYLFHKIAIEIKRRWKDVEFLGSVTGDEYLRHLKTQKEIKYLCLPLVEEIALRYKGKAIDENILEEFEKKYGLPNIWPYIYADRNLVYYSAKYSHHQIKKIVYSFFEFYEQFLEKYKPTAIISWPPASIDRLVLIKVAQSYRIPCFIIQSARIPGRVTIIRNIYDKWEKIEEKLKILKEKKLTSAQERMALEFINEFEKSRLQPDSASYYRKPPKIQIEKWWKIFKYFYYYYITGELKRDYMRPSLFKRVGEEILPFLRYHYLKSLYIFEKPRKEEAYAYFPLHFEPEASVMVLAPFFVDQISLLWNIAKSLPINMKLYVKEHIPMLGRRPVRYYKEIKKIPNVKLIEPFYDSHALIKNSRIIFTITGTAGWEGILYKKPVINFGNAFYNASGLVENITDVTKLPYVIKNLLSKDSFDSEKLYKFIVAVLESTYSGQCAEPLIDPGTILPRGNITMLTDALLEEIELVNHEQNKY